MCIRPAYLIGTVTGCVSASEQGKVVCVPLRRVSGHWADISMHGCNGSRMKSSRVFSSSASFFLTASNSCKSTVVGAEFSPSSSSGTRMVEHDRDLNLLLASFSHLCGQTFRHMKCCAPLQLFAQQHQLLAAPAASPRRLLDAVLRLQQVQCRLLQLLLFVELL